MLVENKELIKKLDKYVIKADLLREFLSKDSIPASIVCIENRIELLATQKGILERMKEELERRKQDE